MESTVKVHVFRWFPFLFFCREIDHTHRGLLNIFVYLFFFFCLFVFLVVVVVVVVVFAISWAVSGMWRFPD